MAVKSSFFGIISTKKMKKTGKSSNNYINTQQYHGFQFQLQDPRIDKEAFSKKKKSQLQIIFLQLLKLLVKSMRS